MLGFMIVPSMSSEELVSEYLKDFENLERKFKYLVKEVRKTAIRTRNKHYEKFFNYKSPLKNTWLIHVEHNNGKPHILPVLYYLNKGRINAMTKHPDKNAFTHYISHFFQRYNERFLKQDGLTVIDALKSFIPDNSLGTYEVIPDEDSEELRVFTRFRDGVGLGVFEKTNRYTIEYLRTFISADMIGNWQKLKYDLLSMDFEQYWEEENQQ